jgi:hypothetical protein
METKSDKALKWLLKTKLGLTKNDLPWIEMLVVSFGSLVFSTGAWLATKDIEITLLVAILTMVFFVGFVVLLFVNKHDMRT